MYVDPDWLVGTYFRTNEDRLDLPNRKIVREVRQFELATQVRRRGASHSTFRSDDAAVLLLAITAAQYGVIVR